MNISDIRKDIIDHISTNTVDFKAWDKRLNSMDDQFFIHCNGTTFSYARKTYNTPNIEIELDNNLILLQNTGYRDGKRTKIFPKGQAIFEGDIIVIPDTYPFFDEGKKNYVAVVLRVFGGFQTILYCVNKNKRGISHGANQGYIEDDKYTKRYLIIGNIFENPELLECTE